MKLWELELLIKNLRDRNIEGYYFDTFDEAKQSLLAMIGNQCSIGIGNSITLKRIKISEELQKRGNIVYDKTLSNTREESKILKKKALLSDWYITGTNAISLEGHIVNMDHSGNRVAAMLYGPDHVVIIVGTNKITKSLEDAIFRVRNIASPKNAKRAGFNPPCVELGKCIDCKSKERVCNNLVIIEGQTNPERMKVFIINQKEGF